MGRHGHAVRVGDAVGAGVQRVADGVADRDCCGYGRACGDGGGLFGPSGSARCVAIGRVVVRSGEHPAPCAGRANQFGRTSWLRIESGESGQRVAVRPACPARHSSTHTPELVGSEPGHPEPCKIEVHHATAAARDACRHGCGRPRLPGCRVSGPADVAVPQTAASERGDHGSRAVRDRPAQLSRRGHLDRATGGGRRFRARAVSGRPTSAV